MIATLESISVVLEDKVQKVEDTDNGKLKNWMEKVQKDAMIIDLLLLKMCLKIQYFDYNIFIL